MSSHLIYFADPMCSWCWGFAPVLRAVRLRHGEDLPVRLVLGGLAPGTTKVLDDEGKKTIRHHWEHVIQSTGQPFDFGFFDREGFVYDTEPACRAVVAARRLAGPAALDFLNHLHEAFYAGNRDVTDPDTLVDLAADFGLERRRFAEELEAEETRRETWGDFQISRKAGIDGYPALLAGDPENGYSFVTLGYQPASKIEGLIESWLAYRRGART